MSIFAYSLILMLLPLVFGGYSEIDNENLKRYLEGISASGYNKKISPATGPDPVNVGVSAYILDVYRMDDSNMDFTADFYFRQYWTDSRLQFKGALKDKLKPVILRDVDDIWTPDLFFIEERQGLHHKIIHPNIFCKISPDGSVLFSTRLSITFSCPMNLLYYPHDIQECPINVESYGFQKKEISLSWINSPAVPLSFSKHIEIPEFQLINAVPSVREISLSIGNWSSLGMNLTFKRKIGHFALRLYVPFTLLVILTSLSFWIRAEQRCLRLSLLLVILYLMVSITTSMNSEIPQTSYTKASDVWIGFCHSLAFAAFLEFIVVGVLSSRKSEEGSFENNAEITLTLASDGKELTDSPKSPLTKVMHMFNTRRAGQNALSDRIDTICRIVFPTVFVFFIIIYCAVYLSG